MNFDETGAIAAMGSLSKTSLQNEGIEYDRRQIRRKLRERIQERGEDLDEEEDIDLGGEDESVYDDAEFFPWKQREAAVEAAAMGGRTEGRMEGIDSLERALQAHTHKLHYGRGRGFGWSDQQNLTGKMRGGDRNLMASRNQLTDWTSFRHLNTVQETSSDEKSTSAETNLEQPPTIQDIKAMKAYKRHLKARKIIYLVSAIAFCSGFAYFIVKFKMDLREEEKGPHANNIINAGSESVEKPSTRHLGSDRKESDTILHKDSKFSTFQEILASKWSATAAVYTEGTPQYSAVHWLSHLDVKNLGVPSSKAETEHLLQRYALATLYFATGGNGWSFADHFMTGLHECEWNVRDLEEGTMFGASDCEGGKVTSVILPSNNLQGKIPEEIGLLTNIKILDLRGNKLFGELPTSLSTLSDLTHVSLEGNFLSGDVDPIICGLSLQHLAMNCGPSMLVCNCCDFCCIGIDKCVRTVVA